MKIITEPSVHVLALPLFFPHPHYELPDDEIDAGIVNGGQWDYSYYDPTYIHNLIAHAGKGCYDSYGKDGRSIKDHIVGLINSKHGSVLEHAHISLFLEGISRGCSHEIVRHRHFNYSQRSTRYTAEEDAAIVLEPFYASIHDSEHYQNDDGNCSCSNCIIMEQFLAACELSVRAYGVAIAHLDSLGTPHKEMSMKDFRKYKRGKARQLLPHALETRMTMTGNLRAWRHFLEQRSTRGAEPEIRRLAEKIFFTLRPLAPYAFADYKEETVDGFLELTTENPKV